MRREIYMGEPEIVTKFVYHTLLRSVVSNDQTTIALIRRECTDHNMLKTYYAAVNNVLDTITEQRDELRRSVTVETVTFLTRTLESEGSKLAC